MLSIKTVQFNFTNKHLEIFRDLNESSKTLFILSCIHIDQADDESFEYYNFCLRRGNSNHIDIYDIVDQIYRNICAAAIEDGITEPKENHDMVIKHLQLHSFCILGYHLKYGSQNLVKHMG